MNETVDKDPALTKQEREAAIKELVELARHTREFLNDMARPSNRDIEIGAWLHQIRAYTRSINKALSKYRKAT